MQDGLGPEASVICAIFLAKTKGNVEAVLFWNFSIKFPHGGHTSVSAAAIHTSALDRLQIWSAGAVLLASVQGYVTRRAEVEHLLVLHSLSAFSVHRSGQKVRGRGLIYRYSVASGAAVASLAPGGQLTVPEGPELAGLGQVGVHHPETFGQLCVDTIVSIYSFENFVAFFLVGQVVWADTAEDGRLTKRLPRAVARGDICHNTLILLDGAAPGEGVHLLAADLVPGADLLGMVAGGQRVHWVGVCLLVAGAEAGVVHQEVLELVTVRVQPRLLAEAGRCEEWKGLKSSKGSLALGNSGGRTGD